MSLPFSSCAFCWCSFDTHIAGALFQKYSSSINFYCAQKVDALLREQPNVENVRFNEIQYVSDDCQYLKRQYKQEEFPAKIQHLAQYYKFNRDVPRCFNRDISSILYRYHDRLHEYDFRRVKAALKKEQGISLTTQKNESSFINSDIEVKSKYSTVLQSLAEDSNSQSQILNRICHKIGQAYHQIKYDLDFKGSFAQTHRKFQHFMQRQQNKAKAVHLISRKANHYNLGNNEPHPNKQNTMKNRMNFLKKIKSKAKQIQKTTANQTISRQERTKRVDKLLIKPLQIDKAQQLFKPLTIALKTAYPSKTIDQIYKSSFNHDKYQSIKSKKTIETKPSKSRVLRPSSKSLSKLNANKQHNDRYIVETDRINREQHTKIGRSSTLKRISSRKGRQPSMESHKALPLAKQPQPSLDHKPNLQKQSRNKSLSKSKSKTKLFRQASKQYICKKQPSVSNFQETAALSNRSKANKQRTISNIDRLLNKKLALFVDC